MFASLCLFGQTPGADFTSDIQSGCSPIVVNFKDASTGNPTAWSWDFGNGATATKQNPSTTYFKPGTYTVTLTATNSSGSNTVTRQAYIHVYEVPNVDFSADIVAGCTPVKVSFTDKSPSTPGSTNVSWLWDFGNGTQSTDQNPVTEYNTTGDFNVVLKVTNDKGCSKTVTKADYINMTPGVNVQFTHTPPFACQPPANISFTSTSTGPGNLTYTWNFGDSATATGATASHIYTARGTYPVSLAVTSDLGCTDTLKIDSSIAVGEFNTDFTVDKICQNAPVTFTNSSMPQPTASSWQFSDGTSDSVINPVKKFTTAGDYTITLINTYSSCTDTAVKTISVLPQAITDFSTADSISCQPPLTANFNSSSQNASSYEWDFGDSTTATGTNVSHIYNSNGIYTVTLITVNANGCTDTLQKKDYIKIAQPTISFSNLPVRGCVPYTLRPIAVIKALDNVTSYTWDFGDGTTATGLNPSHTYTQQGTYTIILTITTSSGCTVSDTVVNAVKVGTHPKADFTADITDLCASQKIQFTNLSAPADSYLWKFDDNGSSTKKDPLYQFSDTGWRDVKLIVYNNGCPDSIEKKKYVYIKAPIAHFEYRPDCNNRLDYAFTDKSIDAQAWQWDFGDGNTSNQQNPKYTYAGYGTYNVSLTVTNQSCSYTLKRTVKIVDNTPDFTASAITGCKPFVTYYTASSPNAGIIQSYTWYSGQPGVSITRPNNRYGFTYYTPGDYTVTLITTDTFSCKDTMVKTNFIRVNGPNANFSSASNHGCIGLTTTFNDNTATDGVNPITNWQWNFGDSTDQSYTQPPFSHTYRKDGWYDVTLLVTDSAGCTNSITKQKFVGISDLKAAWQATDRICPNARITFTNQTTGLYPFTTLWNFGDKDTSTAFKPTHIYTDTGLYTVSMIVADTVGCVDTLVQEDYVHVAKAIASFEPNNQASYCLPFDAHFTNTSYFANSYLWDLGTGTSTQKNPSNYYSQPGTYNIKLKVTGPGGCQDSTSQTIQVFNSSDAQITYSNTVGCSPVMVSFSAFTKMYGHFIWDFGDGNIIDTSSNVIDHMYPTYGSFVPKIILMEPSGCVVPVTGIDTIQVKGVDVNFSIDKYLLCDSGYVFSSDSTTYNDPIVSYNWNFGDGTISHQQQPAHNYTSPGIYPVSLNVQTQAGCADTLQLPNPVKVVQSPLISIEGDSIICINDRLRQGGVFNRTDTSAVQWAWAFPNGNNAYVQYPASQQYTTAGNFTTVAVAINSSGCADTAFMPVIVKPVPQVTMPSTITKQAGYPLKIPVTYSPDITSYTWQPASDLSCTDCPQPVTNARFNTKYTISVVDNTGCSNTGEVQVIVTCQNANVFVPNTFSPNGDGSNDIFYVRGRGLERVKSLRIFNRWGQIVFEKREFNVNDASAGWNGRYNNNRPQADVYVYQLEVYCENGEVLHFDGNIALIL